MAKQVHIRAMNRAIKALGIDQDPVFAAYVEICRFLARQMDAVPEGGWPSARLMASYRGVVRDLYRYRPAASDRRRGAGGESDLDRFRRERAELQKPGR